VVNGSTTPDVANSASRTSKEFDALATERDQMSELLRSAIAIGSDLDLDAVLHRIVNAAARITGAQYAALGIWSADGTLESFLHVGMDPQLVRKLGHLPHGKGILGELRTRSEPLRLADLTQHPSAVGFPAHHPTMRAFVGMPIVIGGEVFGSIYIADDRDGRLFNETDEITMRVLASAAAMAIENARLYERVRLAARWASASREITTTLLSSQEAEPLRLIAERLSDLAEAEQAIVLVPVEPDNFNDAPDTLVVVAAAGLDSEIIVGQPVPVCESTTGEVFLSGKPLITEGLRHAIPGFTDHGERPAIVVPLVSEHQALGVILLARNASKPSFDSGYLDLASDFAGQAAIALTLSTAREYGRELSVLADRERIARDLHDRVIQRVFAVAIDLQSTVARVHTPAVSDRIDGAIDQLQQVINDIRLSIFDLKQPTDGQAALTQRIQEAVSRHTDNTDIMVTLQTSGPLNVVSPKLADDAEAVVIEALSNVVRHSGADTITVAIAVDDELHIDICDNGSGIGDDNYRSSGLDNMIQRAKLAGGHCEITTPSSGGTRVNWDAPLLPP
jgi:signal transduction histidine kinase